MKVDKKQPNKHQVELTVRVNFADAQKELTHAAAHLSQHHPIKGFRPGKAPYDIVKRELGEPRIIEEALDDIVNNTFNSVVQEEKIHHYGKVDFDLVPMNPDEVVAYKAILTLMPQARLGKWQDKKIKRQEVAVADQDLEGALNELANMTTTDEPSTEPAKSGDKAVVDFEVIVDGKLIEGGHAKDFALVIGEGRMIPGFEEKIIGSKPGDKIEFELSFPKDYQAAHLSGKPGQFKITVNQVLKRVKPAIDDSFAARLGIASIAELKSKLSENIKKEKADKEEERLEIAAIRQVTDTADFDDLPQVMIDDTVGELVHEFEHSLAHQRVNIEQYLSATKKTMDQIKKEFEPKAVERIKSSLALGKLAEQEQLKIDTREIEEELAAQRRMHASNQEALNDIEQPAYRRHVANSLINRKLIKFIKEKIVE